MLTVNAYFNNRVKSIGFQTQTLPATVGVMMAGEYQFDTNQKETMTVISGQLAAQLPGSDRWQTFSQGESFVVEANQIFSLKVDIETAYLCTYQQ